MPIIFFVGQGVTPKAVNYQYINTKYIINDFVTQLKTIDEVIIPDIPYHHIYYYQKLDIKGWKERYKPINKLTLSDISLSAFVKKLYKTIDKRKKYILMGHSDGIYFAMEFARLYPMLVTRIISLDGSWITTKMCKQRLSNWKKNGKTVKLIKTQTKLNNLMDKLKNEIDNISYIRQIFDHTRYEHTLECINKKYENIIKNINFTIFRDFNGDTSDEINKQFNSYAMEEDNILSKIGGESYEIFWLVNAGHDIWFNDNCKRQIINYVKCINK